MSDARRISIADSDFQILAAAICAYACTSLTLGTLTGVWAFFIGRIDPGFTTLAACLIISGIMVFVPTFFWAAYKWVRGTHFSLSELLICAIVISLGLWMQLAAGEGISTIEFLLKNVGYSHIAGLLVQSVCAVNMIMAAVFALGASNRVSSKPGSLRLAALFLAILFGSGLGNLFFSLSVGAMCGTATMLMGFWVSRTALVSGRQTPKGNFVGFRTVGK